MGMPVPAGRQDGRSDGSQVRFRVRRGDRRTGSGGRHRRGLFQLLPVQKLVDDVLDVLVGPLDGHQLGQRPGPSPALLF